MFPNWCNRAVHPRPCSLGSLAVNSGGSVVAVTIANPIWGLWRGILCVSSSRYTPTDFRTQVLLVQACA